MHSESYTDPSSVCGTCIPSAILKEWDKSEEVYRIRTRENFFANEPRAINVVHVHEKLNVNYLIYTRPPESSLEYFSLSVFDWNFSCRKFYTVVLPVFTANNDSLVFAPALQSVSEKSLSK